MILELKAILSRAEEWGSLGPNSCEFLAKHGPALIAAVELAEAVASYYDDDSATRERHLSALQAYRAAKEPTND